MSNSQHAMAELSRKAKQQEKRRAAVSQVCRKVFPERHSAGREAEVMSPLRS